MNSENEDHELFELSLGCVVKLSDDSFDVCFTEMYFQSLRRETDTRKCKMFNISGQISRIIEPNEIPKTF